MGKIKLTSEQLKLLDEFYWDIESNRLSPKFWRVDEKEKLLIKVRTIFNEGEYDETDRDVLNKLRQDYINNKK